MKIWDAELDLTKCPKGARQILMDSFDTLVSLSNQNCHTRIGVIITRLEDPTPPLCSSTRMLGDMGWHTDETLFLKMGPEMIGIEILHEPEKYDNEIRISIPPRAPYLVYSVVIPFILSQFLHAGIVPVHSCVLVLHDRGVLVGGAAGSGRTGVLLRLLSRGADFVSEDWSLVSSNREAIGLGSKITLACQIGADLELKDNFKPILSELRTTMPEGYNDAILDRALTITVWAALSHRTLGGLLPWPIVNRIIRKLGVTMETDVSSIWPEKKVLPRTSLDHAFYLTIDDRIPADKNPEVTPISGEEIARRLSIVNQLEFKKFVDLAEILRFAWSERRPSLGEFFQDQQRQICLSLGQADCYKITGTKNEIQRLAPDIIQSLVSGRR